MLLFKCHGLALLVLISIVLLTEGSRVAERNSRLSTDAPLLSSLAKSSRSSQTSASGGSDIAIVGAKTQIGSVDSSYTHSLRVGMNPSLERPEKDSAATVRPMQGPPHSTPCDASSCSSSSPSFSTSSTSSDHGNRISTRATRDVSVTIDENETDSSFAAKLCGAVSSDDTVLVVSGASVRVTIPTCLYANAPNLESFTGSGLIINDFAVFSEHLTTLVCTGCFFERSPPPTTTGSPMTYEDGFNDLDGTWSWSELSSLLPALVTLDLSSGTVAPSTLPNSFSATLLSINLRNTSLVGTIPESLLSLIPPNVYTTFSIDLSRNDLEGTLPSSLMSAFSTRGGGQMQSFVVDFSHNDLSGPLPPNLFTSTNLQAENEFIVRLSHNRFNGSLTQDFLAIGLADWYCNYVLDVSHNELSGVIDGFFEVPLDGSFTFDGSHNRFVGPLPAYIFPTNWTPREIVLILSHNLLDGAIPERFLSSCLWYSMGPEKVVFRLDHNHLNGSISDMLLRREDNDAKRADDNARGAMARMEQMPERKRMHGRRNVETSTQSIFYGFSVSEYLEVLLNDNDFTGSLPASLLQDQFRSQLSMVIFDVSNNNLEGDIPDTFLTPVSTWTLRFNIANNSFTQLPIECVGHDSMEAIQMDASGNSLTSIPNNWDESNCPLESVNFNNNPLESLEANFFVKHSKLVRFTARQNALLSGSLPTLNATLLNFFDFSESNITFCDTSSKSTISAYSGICSIADTAACGCLDSYIHCMPDGDCPLPIAPITAPVAVVPVNPPTPVPTVMPSSPVPTVACNPSTQPSYEFRCSNGSWTAAFVSSPKLVIPSGAGKVVISGQLQSTSVELNGLGTYIELNGCAPNLTTIEVDFSVSEANRLGKSKTSQTLLTASNSSCTNLNGIAITTKVAGSNCKKVKVEKSISSDRQTLSSPFSLDRSECDRWWIILVSVISAAVIISVIVTVIVVVVFPKAKLQFRPFAGSDGNRATL